MAPPDAAWQLYFLPQRLDKPWSSSLASWCQPIAPRTRFPRKPGGQASTQSPGHRRPLGQWEGVCRGPGLDTCWAESPVGPAAQLNYSLSFPQSGGFSIQPSPSGHSDGARCPCASSLAASGVYRHRAMVVPAQGGGLLSHPPGSLGCKWKPWRPPPGERAQAECAGLDVGTVTRDAWLSQSEGLSCPRVPSDSGLPGQRTEDAAVGRETGIGAPGFAHMALKPPRQTAGPRDSSSGVQQRLEQRPWGRRLGSKGCRRGPGPTLQAPVAPWPAPLSPPPLLSAARARTSWVCCIPYSTRKKVKGSV